MKQKIPEGYVIDVEKSNLEKGVIEYKKKDTTWVQWYELSSVEGFYLNSKCNVIKTMSPKACESSNRDIFSTKPQVEAIIAIAQLTHHLARVNGEWVPDYSSGKQKFAITCYGKTIHVEVYNFVSSFLVFKDEDTAVKFRLTYEDLIKQAAPILFGVVL